MNAPASPPTRSSRLKLLGIAAVFAAPFLVALALTLTGWQPGAKGNGEPVLPQRNLQQEHVRITLDDGSAWRWRDSEPRLTLVALAAGSCGERCFDSLTAMAKARIMLNRNQPRLRLLYLGPAPAGPARVAAMKQYWTLGRDPDGALARFRPGTPGAVSALLVESDGTALSFYPAGSDVAGLARDLQKVVR